MRQRSARSVGQLADLIRARKLFCYGETRDYFDHANCLGWVRVGDESHGAPFKLAGLTSQTAAPS